MAPLNSPKEKLTEQRMRTLQKAAQISSLLAKGPTIGPNSVVQHDDDADTHSPEAASTSNDAPVAAAPTTAPDSTPPQTSAKPAPKWRYDTWRPVRNEADPSSDDTGDTAADSWRPTPTHLTLADCRAVRFRMAQRSADNQQRQIVRAKLAKRQQAYDQMLDQLQQFKIDETAKAMQSIADAQLAKVERLREAERRFDEEAAAAAAAQRAIDVETRRQRAERTARLLREDETRRHFAAIKSAKSLFIVVYERLVQTILQQQLQLPNFGEYSAQQAAYLRRYEELLAVVNGGQIGAAEVEQMETMCDEMKSLQRRVDEEVNESGERLAQMMRDEQAAKAAAAEAKAKADAAELERERQQQTLELEQKAQLELEQQQQQQQQQQQYVSTQSAATTSITTQPTTDAVDTSTQPAASIGDSARFVHPERLAAYNATIEFYEQYKLSVKPLQADDTRKTYRFNCQKAVNIPLNAISAVNPQHLCDKYDKLCGLLAGAAVQVGTATVSAAEHPLGVRFCSMLAAKKLVQQADSMISTDPKHAYPIAAIIVAVWQRFPDVGRLCMAYLYKESPYLAPYFLPRHSGQSDAEFLQSLGYRYGAEGQPESTEMYLKRQTGMARLYAAIVVAQPRRSVGGGQHPHGLANGWLFVAHFMNLDPIPDVCATLLHEFLVVAGADLWRAYGQQFHKLLVALYQQYLERLNRVADTGGPRARLEGLLVRVLQDGRFEEPEGRLPPNFW